MTFKLTAKQNEANALLGGPQLHTLLDGGSRCVAGHTVLDGHTMTIAEQAAMGRPIPVMTSHGAVMAEAPFRKGECALLKVRLSDCEIEVTPDHRFWTGLAWVKAEALTAGSLVAVCTYSQSPRLTNWESSPPTSPAGGLHYPNRETDYPSHYSRYHRPYGGQPLPQSMDGPVYHASECDEPAHSRGYRHGEVLELDSHKGHQRPLSGEDSHYDQWSFHPSMRGDFPEIGQLEQLSAPACERIYGQFPPPLEIVRRFEEQFFRLGSFEGQQDSCESLSVRFSRLPCSDIPLESGYSLQSIISITTTAVQPYYTLHVPKVEHYFANGIMHHNSGKTFIIMRAIITRALAYESRHGVFRQRFSHLKSSIIFDTLPKMMGLCFPGVMDRCHLNKSDWFLRLPNRSEVWFAGLDDKERTEKVLGQEFATLFLNECSQIALSSRNIAMTRLAQKTPLRLRAWYDCNPPSESHWTNKLFYKKIDPDTKTKLADPENYATLKMNPASNMDNLTSDYFKILEGLPTKQRNRFLYGQFASDVEGALWTAEALDVGRVLDGDVPDLQRIIIAIDPSGCSGPEDLRSDEVGIVLGGLGVDGRAYIMEDLSGKFGPQRWGQIVLSAYERWRADAIVAEINYGGAMVKEVIRAAASEAKVPMPSFKMVHASRGKVVRAEPVAALYGNAEKMGKISHVGRFPLLEDQLCVAEGTLIETDRGQIPIELVTTHDRVMTRKGFAPLFFAGYTGMADSLVEIECDGSKIQVTQCHPIYSQSRREFVGARNVNRSDTLLVSRRWASTAHQSLGVAAGITECPRGTIATREASYCTERSMRPTLGRSLRSTISTTLMRIRGIISRAILNLSPVLNMLPSTSRFGIALSEPSPSLAYVSGAAKKPQRWPDSLPAIVQEPALCESGALANQRNCIGSIAHTAASYARAGDPAAFSAVGIAKPITALGVLDVKRQRQPVFNLSVVEGHLPEYFANGILVHNCGFTTSGYSGERSPDRADALVWLIAELFPALSRPERKNYEVPVDRNEAGAQGWMS